MKQKIISILKEIRPEFEYSSRENFIESGMLDSFDIVNLVNTLDEEYNISIDGLDIIPENFYNLDSIVALLIKYNCK